MTTDRVRTIIICAGGRALERKLTAILCADVFGYSRLMGEDEEATLRTLSSYRKLIDSFIEQHHGRFVNSAGDSVLAEFASVVNAVQCAVEIQTTLKAQNTNLPPERRMEFRIGVNLGDVMVDGEQIYGDGVNVAARLESLAEPGGICVSAIVHDQIKNKLALNSEDLGLQTVKNIAEPVRVLRVTLEGGTATRTTTKTTERFLQKHWRGGVFSLAGLALIAAVIVFVLHLSLRPPATRASIPPAQSPGLQLPSIPSIAVLPFTNMSGDPRQEYFGDGISDDLTTALSRLPGLFVIARSSSFTYKGKAVKVQEVSRELGVKYVLEGSVHKAGDRVWITAQLVDATTGAELWAERYGDRPMRDIFSLQDAIVQKIVTTLNLQLAVLGQYGTLRVRQTDNLEAYDYFLRGLEFSFNPTKEANEKARQMFEKAIELDPKYADAYAELGNVLWTDLYSQWSHDPHGLDRGIQLEQQSIALDNSNASAHAVLSRLYLSKGQDDLSITAAKRALALAPNGADGNLSLGLALVYSGKPAEAVEAVERAMRNDPQRRDLYVGIEGVAYTFMGRYEEAIPDLKRGLARYSNLIPYHLMLTACYVELGRNEEARAEAAEVMRINPQFSLAKVRRIATKETRDRIYADIGKAGLK